MNKSQVRLGAIFLAASLSVPSLFGSTIVNAAEATSAQEAQQPDYDSLKDIDTNLLAFGNAGDGSSNVEVTSKSEELKDVSEESAEVATDGTTEEVSDVVIEEGPETPNPDAVEVVTDEENQTTKSFYMVRGIDDSNKGKYIMELRFDGEEICLWTDEKNIIIPANLSVIIEDNGESCVKEFDLSQYATVDVNYYLFIPNVDPKTIDKDYIGVAPLGYIGPMPERKNYGKASNGDEVNVRAQKTLDAIDESNEEYTREYGGPAIRNSITKELWTLKDIATVIRYINGAQPAYSEAEAQYLNDLYLALSTDVFINDPYRIEDIAYKSGNSGDRGPITEEDVKKHVGICEKVSLFDLFMGDSTNGAFFKWVSDKLIESSKETDPEKSAEIYDELMLAVMAMYAGNGYVLNGVNYKVDDIKQVNDLVFITEVLIAQASGNLNYNEIGCVMYVQDVGLVRISLDDVLRQLNALCYDELVKELEQSGVDYRLGVIVDGEGNAINPRNLGSVMQIRAISQALYVGVYGDSYYDQEYSKYYDGPYDTGGSEFVFKR